MRYCNVKFNSFIRLISNPYIQESSILWAMLFGVKLKVLAKGYARMIVFWAKNITFTNETGF